MQHDIQDIFNQIREKKEQMKDLKTVYKDLLASSEEYKEIEEKMKVLREKKKRIMQMISEQCASEITKIEDLKIDLESDQEMLNDIAITKYTQGESIEITDKYDNTYEPIFSVKFKKAN